MRNDKVSDTTGDKYGSTSSPQNALYIKNSSH